ncbi:MAG: VWA domain-containing protein [Clostridia bacterium]|nr:VWA domain-containing protein [Clostridia bacterium]
MSFLTNNGLLWLILSLALALIVLLIIYLIRPNYQQKYVSSTFVWVLSLRYRKRKVPINMIRNILIIICQVLILAACAFIIARPALSLMEDYSVSEVVLIMDTSASMRTENDDGTRIERAVAEATLYGREILEEGGIVTVISCGDGAKILLERAEGADRIDDLELGMEEILENGCTYASTNLNDALQICEDRILNINADAEIYVYTDSIYSSSYTDSLEGINIMYIGDENTEWNAAILDAYTEKVDGYYALYVEFATYGRSGFLNFEITIKNPKYEGDTLVTEEDGEDEYFILDDEVYCDGEDVMTFVMMYDLTYTDTYAPLIGGREDEYSVNTSADYTIYAYDEIEVKFADSVDDSYGLDNVYYVYGGNTQIVNVLYTTIGQESNTFVPDVLESVKSMYSRYADEYGYEIIVQYAYVTEDNIDDEMVDADGKVLSYDFYIYEHIAPTTLPTDGIVLLIDPDRAPTNAGFTMSLDGYENLTYECYLSATDEAEGNALMAGLTPENIFLTKSSLITSYDEEYTVLMDFEASGGRYPAFMIKDDGYSKIMVMPFSVNFSNISVGIQFPLLFTNIFTYFYPSAITGSDFTVGDTLTVNSNGEALEIWWEEMEKLLQAEYAGEGLYFVETSDGLEDIELAMPVSFVATEPGRYLLRTQSYFYDAEGNQQKLRDITVFVHADYSESDIFAYGTALSSPYKEKSVSELYDDLLLWFAVALVALIFIEWILHMLEGI